MPELRPGGSKTNEEKVKTEEPAAVASATEETGCLDDASKTSDSKTEPMEISDSKVEAAVKEASVGLVFFVVFRLKYRF